MSQTISEMISQKQQELGLDKDMVEALKSFLDYMTNIVDVGTTELHPSFPTSSLGMHTLYNKCVKAE